MAEPFVKLLLGHINNGRNDEAKEMLNEELARTFVNWDTHGTLLHHAVLNKNATISRKLIELGADVHRSGARSTGRCRTPLLVAVIQDNADLVQVLLEAGARLDIVDYDGRSALQWGLNTPRINSEIFKLLVRKLRTEAAGSNTELAETLIRSGCNMYHTATLGDFDLMECMLERGIDINSKGLMKESVFHVAAQLDDISLADWLLKEGADIDALDEKYKSALTKSVEKGNQDMVQWLLEHGACPDAKAENHNYTPLFAAFLRLNKGPDKFVTCAELLLQQGASLHHKSRNLENMFHCALDNSCDKAAKLLIAHMAMLELLGEPVDKSLIRADRYQAKISKLRKYYEPCQQVLTIEMFGNWFLLDLLVESDRKMRLLVRNEMFLQNVEKVSSEQNLSELYPYYYNTMMRRIEKASRVVKLEDEAVLVICKIFEADYNQFYHFARGVVEYLEERDLERLIQV